MHVIHISIVIVVVAVVDVTVVHIVGITVAITIVVPSKPKRASTRVDKGIVIIGVATLSVGTVIIVESCCIVSCVVHHNFIFQPGSDSDGSPTSRSIPHHHRLPSERVTVRNRPGTMGR